MKQKRHKLRLRKQVIMCIPVALFIITVAMFLVFDRESIFAVRSSGIAKVVETSVSNEVDDIVKLSERDFFVNFTNLTETRQKDNTIIYYANKFHLDVEKTLDIAHKLTNDYKDEKFNTNYVIATDKYIDKIGPFNSFEAGVIYFVRDISRYPTRYGTTREEIRVSDEVDNSRNIIDGIIYIDGFTIYQYLGRICDLYDVDKALVLAISYQESGILKSKLFVNNNNMGGHRSSTGWAKYATLESGIIAHVLTVKGIIDKYEIDMTAEDAIYQLSGPYVLGRKGQVSENWAQKVTIFVNRIQEQDLFSIEK